MAAAGQSGYHFSISREFSTIVSNTTSANSSHIPAAGIIISIAYTVTEVTMLSDTSTFYLNTLQNGSVHYTDGVNTELVL